MAGKSPTPSPSPNTPPPGYGYSQEDAIKGIVQNALGGAQGSSGNGMVWLGADGFGGGMGYNQARQQGYSDKDLLVSFDQARTAPLGWSSSQLKQFVNQGIINKIPGFDVNMGMPEIQAAWESLVKSSQLFNSNVKGPNQKMWTPFDVMDSYSNVKGKFGTVTKGDWVFDVATGERIKYVGKTTKTTTSKQFDISSPEEAQALVTQVLREALGRAPNAQELAKFKASIAGYEKAHPEVTTTVQQLSPDLATGEVNVTSQSSTTSGGVSDAARAALVSEPTLKTKEYGKYQSATTYWDAMMQTLAGG